MEQAQRLGDWRGSVRAALLLRHFFPQEWEDRQPSYISHFCHQFDEFLGQTSVPYVYANLDAIAALVDGQIPTPHHE
jgi:hypothetical protein